MVGRAGASDHPKTLGFDAELLGEQTRLVARKASTTAAVEDLVRHCHSGLDVPDLQRQLLRSLRRVIPVDAAFFATADPETLLFTGAYAEEPLAAATPLFLDNEFASDDVNTFASLATSTNHVASLDATTRSERASSRRYRDIMSPLGLGDELRAALVTGSDCWGYLCLHRADHPLGFTESEAVLHRTPRPPPGARASPGGAAARFPGNGQCPRTRRRAARR
jgi:hypothetical protein